MEKIAELIKHSLTGKDNSTYDVARILWVVGVISYFIFCGVQLYMSKTFSPTEYGAGLGIVLGAGGVSVAVKKAAEPEPEQ